jgi:hypothetical protein
VESIETFPAKVVGEFVVEKQGTPVAILYLADETHPRSSHAVLISIKSGTEKDKISTLECPDNTIYKAGDSFYVRGYNLQEEVNGQWGAVKPEVTTLSVEGDRVYAFKPDVVYGQLALEDSSYLKAVAEGTHYDYLTDRAPAVTRALSAAAEVVPVPEYTFPLYPETHTGVQTTAGEDFNFTAQHVDLSETVTFTDQVGHSFSQTVSNHLSIVAVYSFDDKADYYIVNHTIQLQNQDLPDKEYKDTNHELSGSTGWDVRYGYGHGVFVDAYVQGDDNKSTILVSTHPATTQGSTSYAVGETYGFSGSVGNSGGSIGANVSFSNTTTTSIPDVSIENQSRVTTGTEVYTVHYTIASPNSTIDWGRGSDWAHRRIDTPCKMAINLFAPEGSWIWKVPKAVGDNSTVQLTLHFAARSEISYGARSLFTESSYTWETKYQERWHIINMNPPRRTLE